MTLTFATKLISFNDNKFKILLQNENGPCGLIAMANTLILSPQHDTISEQLCDLVNKRDVVSLDELLQVIADIAIKGKPSDDPLTKIQSNDTGSTMQTNSTSDLNKLLTVLPNIHTGLNINPRFNGSFEKTDEMLVFRMFQVKLVHGWIIDNNNSNSNLLNSYLYEEAQDLLTKIEDASDGEIDQQTVEDANLLKNFIIKTPTQLSAQGISYLTESLKHGQFAVLFRNNHFSTLYKQEGTLYTLVNDLGFKDCQNIVWETLISTDYSDNKFSDMNFEYSKPEEIAIKGSPRYKEKTEFDNDEQLALQLQQEEDKRLAQDIEKKERSQLNNKLAKTQNREMSSNKSKKSLKDEKQYKSSAKETPKKKNSREKSNKSVNHTKNNRDKPCIIT